MPHLADSKDAAMSCRLGLYRLSGGRTRFRFFSPPPKRITPFQAAAAPPLVFLFPTSNRQSGTDPVREVMAQKLPTLRERELGNDGSVSRKPRPRDKVDSRSLRGNMIICAEIS